MPYRQNPQNRREVQVKKNGVWYLKKRWATPKQAASHVKRLQRKEPEK